MNGMYTTNKGGRIDIRFEDKIVNKYVNVTIKSNDKEGDGGTINFYRKFSGQRDFINTATELLGPNDMSLIVKEDHHAR